MLKIKVFNTMKSNKIYNYIVRNPPTSGHLPESFFSYFYHSSYSNSHNLHLVPCFHFFFLVHTIRSARITGVGTLKLSFLGFITLLQSALDRTRRWLLGPTQSFRLAEKFSSLISSRILDPSHVKR